MKDGVKWFYDNFEELSSAAALIFMVALLAVQVVSRYVFKASVPWTEELARFSFLFLVYFSASLAAKHGRHIRITAHLSPLPVRLQNAVILLSDLVTVAFCMLVVYWGTNVYLGMEARPLRSPVLGWEVRWVFLLIPIAFAMQIYRICERYVLFYQGRLGNQLIAPEIEVKSLGDDTPTASVHRGGRA